MNLEELSQFLRVANKNTYAGDGERLASSRLGSKDLEYREGDWLFHDTYFGSKNFIGEEVIYKQNMPVWAMNYYGWVIGDSVDHVEVYKFLKKALLTDHGLIPARGPKKFSQDGFIYQNKLSGGLESFEGQEMIYKNDKLLYKGIYHGGLI